MINRLKTADKFWTAREGQIIEDETQFFFDGYISLQRKLITIGDDQFELCLQTTHDCEGHSYHETWNKNGLLHREGNLPAETVQKNHAIPTETYLDTAVQRFYLNGELQYEIDTTYEDIISTKPLAVRQCFGYDLDPERDD